MSDASRGGAGDRPAGSKAGTRPGLPATDLLRGQLWFCVDRYPTAQEGLSFAALQDARYRTEFELTRAGEQVSLRAEVDGAGYPEFRREAFHPVVHGAAPEAVELDGSRLSPSGGRFVLPNAGSGFSLRFEVR
jgi:hypothetical protein